MPFAVSDVVWQALIGALATITLAWLQIKAAREVKAVKEDLAKTSTVTDVKLDKVIEHTNGMVKKLEEIAFDKGVKSETDKR